MLYLGISGTLHPSESTYELVLHRSPWRNGHRRYEAVPWLSNALARWPDVQIVLTSTQVWKHGLPAVLEHLGALTERVVGFTYEDLTTRVVRQVRTRSGTTRSVRYSDEDYWRMNKGDIVAAHVEWLRPDAWVAVDDEDILWPRGSADHVCIVDGCKGLNDPAEQDRLLTYLTANFGPGSEQ
ncbi:MAG TPA: HAD domain-containing protein [Ideonella sp.]|uniref:HAD domain-containing protein n=1 Tax=Ideonella sp. TaxID=1929293 RepID=UPI002C8FB7F2|nr:HAD domain-containing protein [Ideonella sp.]HSI49171.1 HAD domain-containing protein [Ideonella sp.]